MSARRPGPMTRPKKAKAALPAVPHPIVAGILERIDVQIAALLAVQQTILELVQTINRKETQQLQQEADMSATIAEALENIKVKVAKNTDQIQSAIVFMREIAQLIRDNRTDPAALDALAARIEADDTELAAAVVENTPAAPPA